MKNFTAIQDTREQNPLNLSPLLVVRKTLKTADYSIENFEDQIAIEVKALDDFVMCCTSERGRFEREIERLKEFKYKAIVVKSSWAAIELKQYHGRTHPNAVLGSAMGFALSAGLPIIMAGNHSSAGKLVARLLYVAANRIHRTLTQHDHNVTNSPQGGNDNGRSEEMVDKSVFEGVICEKSTRHE